MRYNWQQPDWPHFSYDSDVAENHLLDFIRGAGRIGGLWAGLSESLQTESLLNVMVSEAIKTSEIEGEYLSRQDVMSSIKQNLGIHEAVLLSDMRAQGVAELMVAARRDFDRPLTEAMLLGWHCMLMVGNTRITAGKWRTHQEPMQIVSGPLGRQLVHFEAPPSERVPKEMEEFVVWFNRDSTSLKQGVLKAAIAHLYFESIHPFEDGNGRIGRVLAEKAVSMALGRPILFSLSKAIEADKKAYYRALQRAQRSNQIDEWLNYFLMTLNEAQHKSELEIEFTLKKAKFFDQFKDELNARQLKVIRRMLEAGIEGFEGGMNTRKYVSITQTSKATATRDLQDLVEKAIFIPIGAGRSARYEIKL
jgi:Fic family protein